MKKYKKIQQDIEIFVDTGVKAINEKVNVQKQALEFHRDDGIAGGLNSKDAGISEGHFGWFGELFAKVQANHLPEFQAWLQDMLTEINEEIP